MGFFGLLQNPHGGYSSELSTEFDIGGKRIEAPLLVPTLTAAEIHAVLAGGQLPDSVYEKAYSHARQRMRLGMNPFAGPSDLHHPMPED